MDWQEFRDWMHSPEVQEAVARYDEVEPDAAEVEQPPLFVVEEMELT